MKASYNWLKDFVEFDLPPEKLAHLLTMAGFEVEALEKIDGDTILDIGVTPNRPDCLCIRGIAREIAAVLNVPFRDIIVNIGKEEGQGPQVNIENAELCPRYSARTVKGVKPAPSPAWLSMRLEACGIRPTSNIVDVTNYILLELGQPMHAFDLDKLAGGKIVVRQAGSTGTFTTLDDEKRTLNKETLLIWDAEKPVAIAGVMGGQNTEVSDSTVNVLLESACFNPSSVRRTSKTLNLSTESSYRFERGIDVEAVTFALDRAAQMIREIAGGRISPLTDRYPRQYKPKKISVPVDKIGSFIGINIKAEQVNNILTNLGFKPEARGGIIEVTPPSFRNDVEMDVDIIEEVARIYGYDAIPSTLPVMQMSAAPVHKTQNLVRTIKDCMKTSGYSEVINFSFMNNDVLDKLNISPADNRRSIVNIKNPLRKEDSAMRTSLIPALLNNVNLNLNRGEKMLRFFEVSNVFFSNKGKLPDEIIQMAAVFLKEGTSSVWQSRHEGFYDLKGALDSLFHRLRILNVSYITEDAAPEAYLHPGKSGYIVINGRRIGYLGVLHPRTAETFDIKGDITIAEIYDLNGMLDVIPTKPAFVPLPRFPYVERDIALVVSDDVTVSAVEHEIISLKSDLVESVTLFDIYKGKSIPKDKKSLAFSIRFRSPDRTLTDNEVDEVRSEIIMRLKTSLNAELRS